MYGFLADMVMLLHFGFILLVITGGLLALYWHRIAFVHLPAVFWALYIELNQARNILPIDPPGANVAAACRGALFRRRIY